MNKVHIHYFFSKKINFQKKMYLEIWLGVPRELARKREG